MSETPVYVPPIYTGDEPEPDQDGHDDIEPD